MVFEDETGAICKVTNQVTVEQPLEQVHGNWTPRQVVWRYANVDK